jgi:preprotein translocase subunit Sss1
MASHETKAQSKNDYVLNPYTGRLIKKFSKTYNRLVTAKLLDAEPSTAEENVVMEMESPEEAKAIQAKLNKKMDKNKVITRRGKKVLKASRRPTRKEIIDKTTSYAVDSIVENKEEIMAEDFTDEQLDEYIRELIAKKLVGEDG